MSCFQCGKKDHLYLNEETNQGFCQHQCGFVTTDAIQAMLEWVVHTSEIEDRAGFFQERGLNAPGSRRFGYYVPLERYTVPYLDENGVVETVRFRASWPEQEPKYLGLPGSVALPYILPTFGEVKAVVIVEGELEAARLWERQLQKPLPILVIGVPGAGVIPKGLQAVIPSDIPIRVIMDNDAAGEVGVKKLIKKVGGTWYPVPKGFHDITDFYKNGVMVPDVSSWENGLVAGGQQTLFSTEAAASEPVRQEEPLAQLTRPLVRSGGLRGYTANEYLAKTEEATPWLVTDVWNENALGFIAGYPKVMKSTLTTALAVALAQGKPFLGRAVVGPRKVLLFQEEDADYVIRERVKRFLGEAHTDNLWIYTPRTMGRSIHLSDPASVALLRNTIEEHAPSLVILDPFANISGVDDENSATQINRVLEELRMMRDDLKTSFAIVHHLRKATEGGYGQRMRGSSVLHAKSECAIYVSRVGNMLTLTLESKVRPDATWVLRYTDAGFEPIDVPGESLDPRYPLLEHLTDWTSPSTLAVKLHLPVRLIWQELERLEEGGKVTKRIDGTGLYTFYRDAGLQNR